MREGTAKHQAITELYRRQPFKLVYTAAGGGTRLIDWLHSVPGASRVLSLSTAPYCADALAEQVFPRGVEIRSAVSEETCKAMLAWAAIQAGTYNPGGPAAALVVTAALATDRERRGQDHAWAGLWTGPDLVQVWHIELDHKLGRARQETKLSDTLLSALLTAGGVSVA